MAEIPHTSTDQAPPMSLQRKQFGTTATHSELSLSIILLSPGNQSQLHKSQSYQKFVSNNDNEKAHWDKETGPTLTSLTAEQTNHEACTLDVSKSS